MCTACPGILQILIWLCLVLRLLCLCLSALLILPLPLRTLRSRELQILSRVAVLLLPRIPGRRVYTRSSCLGWCAGSIVPREVLLPSCLRLVVVVRGVVSLFLRILGRLLSPLGRWIVGARLMCS